MLSDSQNLAFCNGLRDRELESATLLNSYEPQEWLCHAGDYIIVVRYQQGFLGMGVGQSEHETYNDIKVVGSKAFEVASDWIITFDEIKEFMNWTLDDQVCLDL